MGIGKIGHGYDVHRLTKGRKMIIGGVEIQSGLGLLGHSDADVLLHAVIDSLLGALGMGDIGVHFPPSDNKYKDISSLELARRIVPLLENAKMKIVNIDSTIIAQAPKLAPYLPKMKENIARVLEIEPSNVNVKATTEEELGFTGRKEGIAVHAVCLLARVECE